MKSRTCEQFYRRSEQNILKGKGFFTNKINMAMLAAGSGAMALFMAARARQEVVAYDNRIAIELEKANSKDHCCSCCKETEDLESKENSETHVKPVLRDTTYASTFRSGFNQNLVHSAALLAVPYAASRPALTTCLLLLGSLLYCGTEYYSAFNRTPECYGETMILGSTMLLGAWLSFLI